VKVVYEKGTMGIAPLPAVPASVWRNLRGTYYKSLDWTGKPVATQSDAAIDFAAPPVPALAPPPPPSGAPGRGGRRARVIWSARWEGSLIPTASGL
jgi:beta-glucosidase